MIARRLLLSGLVLALVGCHGPRGSPDGSVKAFYAAADSKDWSGMVSIVSKTSREKLGSQERAEAYFAEQFKGWRNVDVDIDDWSVGADEKTATVRFNCSGEYLDRYKVKQVDCSDTFALVKESDGWHINLPATQRMRVQ